MKKINIDGLQNSGNIAEVQVSYKSKVPVAERIKIVSSATAHQVAKKCFNPDSLEYSEEFIILLLNVSKNLLGWVKISAGGMQGTIADSRIIFAVALQTGASAIILVHNHPSGDITPSPQDNRTTSRIVEGGRILNIPIEDHIILSGQEDYYSFADNDKI